MSDGMTYFGNRVAQIGRQIRGIQFPQQQAVEPPKPEVDRQQLTYAQQLFNRRFHEWEAETAGTRFDQLSQSYEDWLTQTRGEIMDSGFFTDELTKEAFSFWMEEAGAKNRVPVAQRVQSSREEYSRGLYDSSYKLAVNMTDTEALVAAVYSAAERGAIRPDQIMVEIDRGMYDINLKAVHDSILAFGTEHGWDAAEAELARITRADLAYQIGLDDAGAPILRELAQEDFDRLKSQVRQELSRARQEEQYRIDQNDNRLDLRATDLYTDRSLGDLLAFKLWLEGTNPATGQPLPADQNPREMMKGSTWRTWYNMVTAAIATEEREAAGAAEPDPEARRQFMLTYHRMVEAGEDPKKIREFVLQGMEAGLLKDGEERTLLQFERSHNDNPVSQGVGRYIEAILAQHELSPAVETLVRQAFMEWNNSDAIKRDANGNFLYNVDRTDAAAQLKIAENLVYAHAGREVQQKVRQAYAIEPTMIRPSLTGLTQRATVDDAERVLAGVQRGEYTGWQNMPQAQQNQLTTLWHQHDQLFQSQTRGLRSLSGMTLDDKGHPVMSHYDETGTVRYFRYWVPLNDKGEPDARLIGGRAVEHLQVWDADAQLWFMVDRVEGRSQPLTVWRDGRQVTIPNYVFVQRNTREPGMTP